MIDTSHDIRTINGLIATTLDSVEGYQDAADGAENSRFSAIFNARAQERRSVVSDLQAQVLSLGGNPEDDGTVMAGAHRVFLGLKAKIMGADDTAVINEVERGEDHIKSKYETAMADEDLSGETMEAVRQAYQSVRAGHEEMSAMQTGLQE